MGKAIVNNKPINPNNSNPAVLEWFRNVQRKANQYSNLQHISSVKHNVGPEDDQEHENFTNFNKNHGK